MSDAVRRIVLTGSESTGKTTLARALAAHHGALWVPEYAREYAESRAAPLDAWDVEPIARGQMRAEDEGARLAREGGHGLLLLDTDLVSTTVYARHYYGACPPWIEAEARRRAGALYLLCDVDLPWVRDAARDRPHARLEIHAMFVQALERIGARWAVVRGAGAARLEAARALLAPVIAAPR